MAQPPPQPPRYLFTKENAPATYSTKWEDLHPETQNVMLEIEKRILEYRDESQRIDQCRRLRDSSVHDNRFELDASNILQELYGITMGMDRQKVTLKERVAVVKDMLQNTDKAVRSFMRLQLKYLQANFYRGTPEKPSPFLQHTVARFEKLLSECRRSIEELEQLLHSDSGKHSSDSRSSQVESLAEVLENVHGFFIHVAAKVESIHERIESMRTAYIADLRRQGFKKNPFLDTDRTETARKEAAAQQIGGDTGQLALPAAQMIHPTMHFSPVPQPTGQATGHLALPAGTGFSSWYASPSAFGFSTTPAASSTPAFGFSTAPAASSTPAFGFSTAPAASSTPAFGFFTAPAVSSTPAFGSTTAPAASSKPAFGFSTAPAASSTPAFGSIIAPAASSTSSLHSTTTGPAPFPSSPFGSFSASSPASGVSAPAASSIPSMLSTTIISPPRQLSRFTVWEEMLSSASGNSDTAAAAAALSSPSSFSTPTGSAAFPSSRFTASASASSHDTSTPASASSSPSPLSPLSSSRSRSLPASGASTISHFSTEAATGSQPSSGTPPRVNKRDGTHLKSPSPKHRLPH